MHTIIQHKDGSKNDNGIHAGDCDGDQQNIESGKRTWAEDVADGNDCGE